MGKKARKSRRWNFGTNTSADVTRTPQGLVVESERLFFSASFYVNCNMKVVEKNVMRLAAVQHLRAVYGIKIKNWGKNKAASSKSNSTKLFGAPLESLPYYNMECGSVPSFLVDACMRLLAHVETEGLFRKSGSVVRLKALRAKLVAGEECLSTALPCDVAGLVKQFFRELPEPVLPSELQEAFLKAQQLPGEEDKTSATVLLSCVLPDRNLTTLRYFFDFLQNVSSRSAENKMDSSNLAVMLAPNLLHSGDGTDKMNANTEKRLKLQAAVVHCLIESAQNFGVLPQSLQEKVPAMMGCETGLLSPTHDEVEEIDLNSGIKKRSRRSFGVFSSATPVIATPSSKRKLPLEPGHSFGFSNKKRRSVKKNLGIDLLPNTFFSGTSTPGSAISASGVLDASQNMPSPAGRSRRQSATSLRRKSRRLSSRHAINRVESGRAGCFSPKVSKKEAPRKSLRLRFSLGKSSKDAGSESIGCRLAMQESTSSFTFTREPEFSPMVRPRNVDSKGPKYISKSEDNLLTPMCDPVALGTSWCAETPAGAREFGSFADTPMNMCLKSGHASEPAIAQSRTPTVVNLPAKLCCASSVDSLENSVLEVQTEPETEPEPGPRPTLLKIKEVLTETESPAAPETPSLPADAGTPGVPFRRSRLAAEQNITFGQMEIAALTPLHIDSFVFETNAFRSPPAGGAHASICEEEEEGVDRSRLIDALDIQSPAVFIQGVSSGPQSTPYKPENVVPPLPDFVTPPRVGEEDESRSEDQDVQDRLPQPRVADHIQHFNRLTLRSPRGPVAAATAAAHVRSPLKFERTPVRQTIRRINSMMGDSRGRTAQSTRPARGRVLKATSLESGLSPRPPADCQGAAPAEPPGATCPAKKPPPVPPKKVRTLDRRAKACALGDVTNKVQPKSKADEAVADPAGTPRPLVEQLLEKDKSHYRGSPRNPLHQARLLSATKPVDL